MMWDVFTVNSGCHWNKLHSLAIKGCLMVFLRITKQVPFSIVKYQIRNSRHTLTDYQIFDRTTVWWFLLHNIKKCKSINCNMCNIKYGIRWDREFQKLKIHKDLNRSQNELWCSQKLTLPPRDRMTLFSAEVSFSCLDSLKSNIWSTYPDDYLSYI
jgi:hypothetical protein